MARIPTQKRLFSQETKRLLIGTTAPTTALTIEALGDHYLADIGGVVAVSTTTILTVTVKWTDPDIGAVTETPWNLGTAHKGIAYFTEHALIAAGTTAAVSVTTTVAGVRASAWVRSPLP